MKVEVELLRQIMQRRGLPPDTSLHTFLKGPKLQRGGCLVVAKAAFANVAVLSVTLPVGVGGKLGLSLREGEHDVPIIGRGAADGLLEAGDEIISVSEHENLQHLAYPEVVELLRSMALQSPLGGRLEIGIIRPDCLRMPVASDIAGKVIGTGGSNMRMLRGAAGVPLVLLGATSLADTTPFPLMDDADADQDQGIFMKNFELLVCTPKTSTAALEVQDLLSSVTNGGLFVLRGADPDQCVGNSTLQDIEERYGTKIHLKWQQTPNDPGAKPLFLLKILLQPISGRKLKIRQIEFALKTLLSNNYIPEERHKRAVKASGLKAGNNLAGMAMDGIVLAPPPSVVQPEVTTRDSRRARKRGGKSKKNCK